MNLLLLESPGKIKTIQSFLGHDYKIFASVGHCYQIERTDKGIDIDAPAPLRNTIDEKQKKDAYKIIKGILDGEQQNIIYKKKMILDKV